MYVGYIVLYPAWLKETPCSWHFSMISEWPWEYIYIYISSTVLMPVFFCLGLDSVEGEFAWNLRIWGNITIVSCTFFRESVEYRSWNWQIENPQFPIHKRKPFLVNLILTQQFYNIHTYIHTYVYYNILWRFEILVKPGKFFSSYLSFFLN